MLRERDTVTTLVGLVVIAVLGMAAGAVVIHRWRHPHPAHLSGPQVEWRPVKVDTEGILLRAPGCECPADHCPHWHRAPSFSYTPDRCACPPGRCTHWQLYADEV